MPLSPRARISAHYRYALSRVFDEERAEDGEPYSHVLLLEDDLDFAPDFVSYVYAFLDVIGHREGGAVVCVSGWDDNGGRVVRAESDAEVGRCSLTTFFPGLGWAVARRFWEDVRGAWPVGDAVGTGWDWWLRGVFEEKGWACVVPEVGRVLHVRGGGGVNVAGGEDGVLKRFAIADVRDGAVQWEKVAASGAWDVDRYKEQLHGLVRRGVTVQEVDEVSGLSAETTSSYAMSGEKQGTVFVLEYKREEYMRKVAAPLVLWPNPRGGFHHTLVLPLTRGRVLILVDARWSPFASRSMARGDGRGIAWDSTDVRRRSSSNNCNAQARKTCASIQNALVVESGRGVLVSGSVGESCDFVCQRMGLACDAGLLEWGNKCAVLRKVFVTDEGEGCPRGCAFETGEDLPARVEAAAPLATRGVCLVSESGLGAAGTLLCSGKFKWTRRVCGCFSESHANLGSGNETREQFAARHDEL